MRTVDEIVGEFNGILARGFSRGSKGSRRCPLSGSYYRDFYDSSKAGCFVATSMCRKMERLMENLERQVTDLLNEGAGEDEDDKPEILSEYLQKSRDVRNWGRGGKTTLFVPPAVRADTCAILYDLNRLMTLLMEMLDRIYWHYQYGTLSQANSAICHALNLCRCSRRKLKEAVKIHRQQMENPPEVCMYIEA